MLKVEIKTGGAAFHCEDPEENPALDREVLGQEVSKLLIKIATDIGHGRDILNATMKNSVNIVLIAVPKWTEKHTTKRSKSVLTAIKKTRSRCGTQKSRDS